MISYIITCYSCRIYHYSFVL